MTMDEIKAIAKNLGIKTGKMKKGELIRAIQIAEGNSACFPMSAGQPCDQAECLWRADCSQA
jgi:hypothetical protein